jgi:hypothetical protein
MSDSPETVRVKAWGEGQGDYVVINAADFDAKIHQKFDGPVELAPSDPAPSDPGTGEPTVAKGPRGLWYVYREGQRVSNGYASQEEAEAAKAGE